MKDSKQKYCTRLFFLFTIGFVLSISTVKAQDSTFIKVSRTVDTLSEVYTKSYKTLSKKLTDSLKTDEEKIKALCLWIMKNIDYDVKMYEKGRFKRLKPNQVLKKRKAICQGYSDLFTAMCDYIGIRSYVVTGYSKSGNYEPGDILIREDHAWNAVKMNGSWYLLDLTWASGNIELKPRMFQRRLAILLGLPFKEKHKFIRKYNYNYLFADPKFIALNHLPVNSYWQLLNNTLPVEVFEKDSSDIRKFIAEKKGKPSSFYSQIEKYEKMEEPLKFLEKAKQAYSFNTKNYQTLAEGKMQHAVQSFVNNYRRSANYTTKNSVYDTCLITMKEAEKDLESYEKSTQKERDLRVKKNEKYFAESTKNIDNQMKLNDKRIKTIYTQQKNVENELLKLAQEEITLQKELKEITEKIMPAGGEKNNAKKALSTITKLAKSEGKINTLLEKKNENQAFDFNSSSDSILRISFNKAIDYNNNIATKAVFRNFFNWNLKYYLDSMEKKENEIGNDLEKLTNASNKNATSRSKSIKNFNTISAQLRKEYNTSLDLLKKVNEVTNDSMRFSNNITSKYENTKNNWRSFNNQRLLEINKQKEKIGKEINDLETLGKYLTKANQSLKREKKAENMRVKKCKAYYFKFCAIEMERSAENREQIKKLEKVIIRQQEFCKKQIALENPPK